MSARGLVLACVLAGCRSPGGAPSAAVDLADFHVGLNVPWLQYAHDFGTCAWGYDGISANSAAAVTQLERASAAGAPVVRWFVFGDGRASPEFGDDGVVSGIEEQAIDDLELLLDLADDAGVKVVPVLLDFTWFEPGEMQSGVQVGGRSGAVADAAGRDALVGRAVAPLLDRVGDHPAVLAWDVINEPEWALDAVGLSEMRALVDTLTDAVHAGSDAPVTLGSANMLALTGLWLDADLDLLQFHYYAASPFDLIAEDIDPDRPIVVGELPLGGGVDVARTLDAVSAGGFAGAWGWSLVADDAVGAIDLDQVMAWTSPPDGSAGSE